jgi:hypothetical protein
MLASELISSLKSLITLRFVARTPRNYYKEQSNQLQALKQIEATLNITQPSDWYKYRANDVIENKGFSIIAQYDGSLLNMLKALYPEVEWDPYRFVYILVICRLTE